MTSSPPTQDQRQEQPLTCPVPHAKSQPLPPGHPPVPDAPASSLFPPTDSKCIFYRSPEDFAQTPPLSRSGSSVFLSSQPSTPSLQELAAHNSIANHFDRVQKLDQARKEANINPLPLGKDDQLSLDPNTTLVLASRNSQLALVQSSHVSAMLQARYGSESPVFRSGSEASASTSSPHISTEDSNVEGIRQLLNSFSSEPSAPLKPHDFPITSMSTSGDQNLRSPLYVIGGEGKAIWTKELEVALVQGGVDAIVHSLKDVPTVLPDGLEIAAILEREDPRDALVVKRGLPYKTLDELPIGSVIGTSSVRRVAQLRKRYPHLVFSDVRGNLNTRLAKLDAPTGPYTALVLAAAGLVRINLADRITAYLSSPVLLHSVGQGSLAVEVRTPPVGSTPATNRDARIKAMIQSIADWRATFRAEAERSLLRQLEGGCSIPVGVETRFEDHDQVEGARKEAVETIDQAIVGDAEAMQRLPNGGQALVTEGHTIPANQLLANESSAKPQQSTDARPLLERLDTESQNGLRKENTNGSHVNSSGSDVKAESAIKVCEMPISNSSVPPEKGVRLYLDSIVTSLDGTRSSRYSSSRVCSTVEDAKELGIEVAKELAEKRGARSILNEVERHRKMAEEADRKRREEARKRKLTTGSGAEVVSSKAACHGLGVLEAKKDGWMRGQSEISLMAELEAFKSAQSKMVNGHTNNDTIGEGDPLEIDRRGLPREDGQNKAWEV
ncbi:hypothetical protein IE53DRAFT_408002 [Violaceomyces palustris]|uniref:Uncharacterized protein n=1 Tax=Violaceomyces palustris TaxID=1673888 RepID=A0ACD0P8I3_9BASI|nr:hypothetical protein IE53DRAFT_408002 [Violaceomyces palustris]